MNLNCVPGFDPRGLGSRFRDPAHGAYLLAGLERLRKAARSSKPLLAVTFDDGTIDNYTNARPGPSA